MSHSIFQTLLRGARRRARVPGPFLFLVCAETTGTLGHWGTTLIILGFTCPSMIRRLGHGGAARPRCATAATLGASVRSGLVGVAGAGEVAIFAIVPRTYLLAHPPHRRQAARHEVLLRLAPPASVIDEQRPLKHLRNADTAASVLIHLGVLFHPFCDQRVFRVGCVAVLLLLLRGPFQFLAVESVRVAGAVHMHGLRP